MTGRDCWQHLRPTEMSVSRWPISLRDLFGSKDKQKFNKLLVRSIKIPCRDYVTSGWFSFECFSLLCHGSFDSTWRFGYTLTEACTREDISCVFVTLRANTFLWFISEDVSGWNSNILCQLNVYTCCCRRLVSRSSASLNYPISSRYIPIIVTQPWWNWLKSRTYLYWW